MRNIRQELDMAIARTSAEIAQSGESLTEAQHVAKTLGAAMQILIREVEFLQTVAAVPHALYHGKWVPGMTYKSGQVVLLGDSLHLSIRETKDAPGDGMPGESNGWRKLKRRLRHSDERRDDDGEPPETVRFDPPA